MSEIFLHTTNNSNSKSDTELWLEMKNGNKNSFKVLYYRHYNHLYNYGCKILPQPATVKDVIQDVFAAIWQSKQKLSDVESVKSYLLLSVRRGIFAAIKREKSRRNRDESYYHTYINRISFTAEDLLISDETNEKQVRLLVEALNKLEGPKKETLYLKFYNGLSYQEIADITGYNVQSCRNHVYKALKFLKTMVNINSDKNIKSL